MIEKNLWPDITLLKQAAMIFSAAFDALVSCVTRFNGEAVMDVLEAAYQAEFYTDLREKFGNDALEAERPYPGTKADRCDLVVYPTDDSEIWIEIKYWGAKEDKAVIGDLAKLKKIGPVKAKPKRYPFLVAYWYETSDIITSAQGVRGLMGLSWLQGAGIDESLCWVAMIPQQRSEQYLSIPRSFGGVSMYRVTN